MNDPKDFPHPWVHALIQSTFGNSKWAENVTTVKMVSWKRLGENTGYLSDIFKATLSWDPPTDSTAETFDKKLRNSEEILEKIPKSVVLKIASSGQSCEGNDIVGDPIMRDTFENKAFIDCMHIKECMVYEWFRKHPENPLPVPKCYLALDNTQTESGGPNILILEDLSRNTGQQDIVEAVTLEQLQNYVRALAQFHAFLLVDDSWKSANLHFGVWEYIQTFIPAISVMIDRLKKEFPEDFSLDTAILHQMNGDKQFWLEEFGGSLTLENGKPCVPILCHGDMWTYNIMLQTLAQGDPKDKGSVVATADQTQNSTGNPEKSDDNSSHNQSPKLSSHIVSFIDWQWACVGSVTQDLARFVGSSVTSEMRRSEMISLLKLYYATLVKEWRGRKEVVKGHPEAQGEPAGLTRVSEGRRGAAATEETDGKLVRDEATKQGSTNLSGESAELPDLGPGPTPFSFSDLLTWWRRSAKGSALLSMIDLPMAGVTIARSQPDGEAKARRLVRRNVAFVEDAFYERF